VTGRRALAAVAVLVQVGSAQAASFSLGERQVQEAVELGERSVQREAFGDEWRVRNAAGDTATVMTPFHRLALAARHAAFRNDPLTPRERDRVLKEQHDRLVFWVELKGARLDFARFYTPRLIAGARHIEPSFTQNERTPARRDDGKFLARCVYGFPTKALSGTSKVVLVVRDGEGRDVSSFTIDLASMR
jgi:hypothetical protein